MIAFDLVTPMASWAAGGNSIVPTRATPTWSAIVGLLGAALGIPRDDDRLVEIASAYALALHVQRYGVVEDDYHTIQSPMAKKAARARVATRRQELGADLDVNTTITRRAYVHDAKVRIFIVPVVAQPPYEDEILIAALNDPAFPLYAGRRSCVIGRIEAVVASREELGSATHWDLRILLDKPVGMIVERNDLLVGRRRFGIRHECLAEVS